MHYISPNMHKILVLATCRPRKNTFHRFTIKTRFSSLWRNLETSIISHIKQVNFSRQFRTQGHICNVKVGRSHQNFFKLRSNVISKGKFIQSHLPSWRGHKRSQGQICEVKRSIHARSQRHLTWCQGHIPVRWQGQICQVECWKVQYLLSPQCGNVSRFLDK